MATGTSRPTGDLQPIPQRRTVYDVRRPRRLRRWLLLLTGLLVVLLAALALMGAGPALEARRALEEGRSRLQDARALLVEGELQQAGRAFGDAEERFGVAADRSRALPLRVASWLPILGRSPRTVTAIADAGVGVSSAGGILTDATLELPGGMGSLAPRNGRVDPRPFTRLAPAVARAAELVAASRRTVQESPGSLLAPGVAPARAEAIDQLADLESTVTTAEGLLRHLPRFLGTERPAHYMLAAQNPAELRGTGGFMGAFSILTVEEGGFRFRPFRPIHDLPTFSTDRIEAPSEEFAENYDRFGGAGFWPNMNMTPHFPSAATAMRTAYHRATGVELDGVILADPLALESLLRFTGPVTVPGVGEVQEDTVVPFVTNQAYRRFTDPRDRKLILGRVALRVFESFLREARGGLEWIRTIADAAAEGRILMNSADPDVQAAFERAGVSGSFGPASEIGDFLSLIQNNGGANKMDFYLDREVTYTVHLGPSGTAEAEVEVTLTNNGPDRGAPRYVIGPYPGISEAGENVSFVDVYCRASCQLREAERDGEPFEVSGGTEVGARFFRDYLHIPSGGQRVIRYRLGLLHAWEPTEEGGRYRLSFWGQPTIRPTHLTVRVIPPDDGRLVPGSEEVSDTEGNALAVSEDAILWSGTPGRRLRLEISLET